MLDVNFILILKEKVMENKTYIIVLETGSYNDYSMQTLFVTNDYEKGLAYVNKYNAIYESLKQKKDSFYKSEYLQWTKANPRPHLGSYNLYSAPKWSKGVNVTKEMQKEREEINAQNREIVQKAHEPMNLWAKAHKDFMDSWLSEHLTEEEFVMNSSYHDDTHYSIEEISWL